ncbi:MAG: molybdopterin dehydrogenase [Porticoccaceae bacterium]|nr:MAG: molybdopterin dehydrogenase [Porticoccaceae bacterium]
MKPVPFDYYAPRTVEEAARLLAEAAGGAAVLAGGQTLLPLLNLRMSQPLVLVDITRIPELKGIREAEGGLWVGAATTQNELLESPLTARLLPALARAVRHVGHHATRNRGTVGGSIALGEPAAELPATAVALGAEVETYSPRGRRRIPAREFYLAPYATVLEGDELVTGIRFPPWPAEHRPLFAELARRPGDFALVGVVGALAVAEGRVERAGLAWFAMGPTPVVARRAETLLQGAALADWDPAAVVEAALADTAPFDDHHASGEYRRAVGGRLLARALEEALGRREAA